MILCHIYYVYEIHYTDSLFTKIESYSERYSLGYGGGELIGILDNYFGAHQYVFEQKNQLSMSNCHIKPTSSPRLLDS